MATIEERIQAIEARNMNVSTNKAWETSMTRRLSIAVITYLTACLFLWLINVAYPFINALVPTGGYLLSTLSLPWFKEQWVKHILNY